MNQLLFFEKPGCSTNARQKRLLREAGVVFEARSILAEAWTRDRLRKFFDGLPISQWFNQAAPRVKSGEVIPDKLDADTALTLMLAEPLLIRRPLLQKDEWSLVGFDWETLAGKLGLAAEATIAETTKFMALEGCSHEKRAGVAHCKSPAEGAA